MDNLCHTLAGAALGDAGLKRRTPLAMGTLVVASNLPDIDVAVFATDMLAVSFRRGWTHGVLSMAVLPAMFAGIVFALDRAHAFRTRERASLRELLLLTYIATWLHVFMDYLNSYGVRLLMPFSNRWFYGDALYIVDPLLYLLLGGAIAIGRVWERRGHGAPWRASRIGLALAGAYVVLMLASNLWARAEVREGLERAGRPPDTRFMVTPVFAAPLRREVIVDTGGRYEKGLLWFEPAPHFRPAGYGVDTNRSHPVARAAAEMPLFQSYLRWSRFPFFVIATTGDATRVYLNDYRYSGESATGGWAGVDLQLQ